MSKRRNHRVRGGFTGCGAASVLIGCAFLFCAPTAPARIVDDTIEQVYPAGPKLDLSIRNTDGRIYIYGSDVNELKVTAVRRAFTQERAERIKVDVAMSGDSVVIETIYPPPPQGSILEDRSGTVDYTILVPQTATLSKVELANGEILIEGVHGPGIEARLGHGRMLLQNCFSPTRANVRQGGLEVVFAWWEEARASSLSAEVSQGDLSLRLPLGAALRLDAATSHGHITNRFAPTPDGSDARTLEMKIGDGGSAEFRLRTINGNIKIEKDY